MSEFSHTLTNDDMSLTETAREQFLKILNSAEKNHLGIRIYVSGSGCDGLTYGMAFAHETSDYDMIQEFDGGTVYLDTVSYHYLQGVEIDFIADVGRERFVFNNAFQSIGGSGGCNGCGASN